MQCQYINEEFRPVSNKIFGHSLHALFSIRIIIMPNSKSMHVCIHDPLYVNFLVCLSSVSLGNKTCPKQKIYIGFFKYGSASNMFVNNKSHFHV